MMLANDLKTYYDEVRRYLDCPKDEQDRLLLSVNKQVIELQVDNPNLDYDGIVEFLGEPESLAASLMERLSPDVVQKFKKKKRRLRLSIIACVAVVVVALSTLVIYTSTIQSGVKISENYFLKNFLSDMSLCSVLYSLPKKRRQPKRPPRYIKRFTKSFPIHCNRT